VKSAYILTLVAAFVAMAALGLRREKPAPPKSTKTEPAYFVSHDWIEPIAPAGETRKSLMPKSAGADLGIVCTVPNCRNCQIHSVWKSSF
jgi:hypothetical protein